MRFSSARFGFTLIELLVVITILGILAVGMYVPYQRYDHIARVRISAERLEQTISEARTLALNGYMMPGTMTNANLAVVLRKGATNLQILAYPHTVAVDSLSAVPLVGSVALVRTIPLESRVVLTDLPNHLDTILLYFTSPRAEVTAFDMGGVVPNPLPHGAGNVLIGFPTATVIGPGALLREVTVHF